MNATQYSEFLQDSCEDAHENWKESGGRELSQSEMIELMDLVNEFFQPKRPTRDV